jgi:DNA-binding GntR family transcriptional regulator
MTLPAPSKAEPPTVPDPNADRGAGGVAERRSMADAAYLALKRRILDSELPPGHQVLEEELVLQLGMSRTPVREALVRLAHEGLVDIVPRRGIRVRALTIRDIREINEVLSCLECAAAERLASRRLAPDELAKLEGAIAGMDAALEANDLAAWSKADFRFHSLLIELCDNRHLAETARQFLERAHRFRTLTTPLRERPIYSNVNHAAVVEAIKRGDPQSAVEIHRAHKRRWSRELSELVDRMNLPE